MCQYWKKQHTCTHVSDRPYIEMCRPGYLSNTVCAAITTDPVPRPSHFPCYPCIKQSVYAEAREKHERAAAAALAVGTAREVARQKGEAEKKAREERVRREAREKAERERVVELKGREAREREAERARVEGGTWMLAEAGSGKKKKGKGVLGGSSVSPGAQGKKSVWEESEKGGTMGGRAGVWGPKKILSRSEKEVVLADVTNGGDGAK